MDPALAALVLSAVAAAISQPLMAVPAFLFVDSFRPTLPYGTGFAAGAMVFMVLANFCQKATRPSARRPWRCS
ncbi:MAG: hypothetical protein OXG58_04065 [Gemmatimonadetes bacterium]|nr:hypothetical protein [Gemmatimonadota bacterium]